MCGCRSRRRTGLAGATARTPDPTRVEGRTDQVILSQVGSMTIKSGRRHDHLKTSPARGPGR